MENMSYCRFENTYRALLECYEALQETPVDVLEEDVGEYERPYIRKLINLCNKIVEQAE